MKKVLAIVFALLTMVTLFGCSSNNTSAKTSKEVRATIKTNSGETKQMTFQELKEIENANSILFEDEYIGADITVTSKITKIGGAYRLTSWFDCDAYVELDAGNGYAHFFKPITEEYAKTLTVGDTITVSGKIGMASVASSFDIYIMKDEISPY